MDKGKGSATKRKRAQILLAADESEAGKGMKDEQIAACYEVTTKTVARTRERFVEESYQVALNGKPRPVRPPAKMDGELEAHLVAMACSQAPEGYLRWSVRLLARELVGRGHVVEISHETVRQTLKKTGSSPGRGSTT